MRLIITVLAGAAALGAVVTRIALSPFGAPTPVVVVTSDLAAGAAVSSADLTVTRWPSGLVPSDALTAERDAVGARLTIGVTEGTVLTGRHVRRDGPLADLRSGMAAVPVPSGMLRGVSARARLDLVATAGDGSGRALARDVRVLAADGDTVWVEVERERAPDVAAAAARGTLSGAVLAP
jgi:pilus assembly protein CpaB